MDIDNVGEILDNINSKLTLILEKLEKMDSKLQNHEKRITRLEITVFEKSKFPWKEYLILIIFAILMSLLCNFVVEVIV